MLSKDDEKVVVKVANSDDGMADLRGSVMAS